MYPNDRVLEDVAMTLLPFHHPASGWQKCASDGERSLELRTIYSTKLNVLEVCV